MSEHDGKMRPLKAGENLHYTDGYRGDQTIAWTLVPSKKPGGRGTEMFGTWCARCLTSWGWTLQAAHAAKLHRAMKKLGGCPRCKDKTDEELAPPPLVRAEVRKDLEAVRSRLRK